MAQPLAERRRRLEAALAGARAAGLPHAGDARSRAGAGLVRALRGRRPRRRDRQAPRFALPARQARDDQGQARAHRRLRRRRLPLAQGRPGTLRRLAAARASTTTRACSTTSASPPASRSKRRKELVEELAPLRENAREGHPWRDWADVAATPRRRPTAHAGRDQPLEPRQGSVVGAAAHRARLRGGLRPPAGRSLPPRDALRPLAPRQAARRLPLRPAGRAPAAELAKLFGSGATP